MNWIFGAAFIGCFTYTVVSLVQRLNAWLDAR